MTNSLISVIIPTYNRAHLIKETLDSVSNQYHVDLECIIVDDGSNDSTEKVILEYIESDQRFKYYKRPNDRLKGANSCRNYGLELSKGKYVNWFDSDDLMEPDFLSSKIKFLEFNHLDFVVSKTVFFHPNGDKVKPNYNLLKEPITLTKFVCEKQFWLTLDGLFSKESIGDIRWKENLKSGQEFNFICNYLSVNKSGLFVNEFLALARLHDNSIQSYQKKSKKQFYLNKYLVYLETYLDLKKVNAFHKKNNTVKQQLIKSIMSHSYNLKLHNHVIPKSYFLFRELFIVKGFVKTMIFMLSLVTAMLLKKGYRLMNYARK